MKDLYIGSGGYVCFDNETKEICPMSSEREAISRIFIANEPTKVHYNVGEKVCEVEAKKDDIIIVFYDHSFETPVVVAKSKAWVSNIKKYNKKEQEAREKWAGENAECCPNCEKCC